jgi:hypothetical protein
VQPLQTLCPPAKDNSDHSAHCGVGSRYQSGAENVAGVMSDTDGDETSPSESESQNSKRD